MNFLPLSIIWCCLKDVHHATFRAQSEYLYELFFYLKKNIPNTDDFQQKMILSSLVITKKPKAFVVIQWLFTQKDYFSGWPHQLTLVRHDGNYRFLFAEIPNWGFQYYSVVSSLFSTSKTGDRGVTFDTS